VITFVLVPVGGATAPVGGGAVPVPVDAGRAAAAGLLCAIIQLAQQRNMTRNEIRILIRSLPQQPTVAGTFRYRDRLPFCHLVWNLGPLHCYPVDTVGEKSACHARRGFL
jgi:hypothetical protein